MKQKGKFKEEIAKLAHAKVGTESHVEKEHYILKLATRDSEVKHLGEEIMSLKSKAKL